MNVSSTRWPASSNTLDRDGPFGFDPRNVTQRDKAIRLCIEASIQDLGIDEASQFAELSVLPEEEDGAACCHRGDLGADRQARRDGADDLVMRLGGLSLLQSLDLRRRTLRLHDNMLWYLRDRLRAEGLKEHMPQWFGLYAQNAAGYETSFRSTRPMTGGS